MSNIFSQNSSELDQVGDQGMMKDHSGVLIHATLSADGINRQGTIYINLDYKTFITCFHKGDLLYVRFLDHCIDLPFCGAYTDVDAGRPVMMENGREGVLAINMGSFAETYRIAKPKKRENGTVQWTLCDGLDAIDMVITLKKKAGYLEEYTMRNITYKDDIKDYPHLNEREFANFRMVRGGMIAEGVLYRSASPVNPIRKRNVYSDQAAREVGVTHFIDLTDDQEKLKKLSGYSVSYLSKQSCLASGMTMDITSDKNRDRIAKVFRYIGQNKGVYDIFCLEGKDRTGFVVSLIQCLMGAGAEEIKEDYMRSFYNYYDVKKGDNRYEAIFDSNLRKTLSSVLHTDFYTADLADAVKNYLLQLGLMEEEISQIRLNLSTPQE